jgi:hypothetical protein
MLRLRCLRRLAVPLRRLRRRWGSCRTDRLQGRSSKTLDRLAVDLQLTGDQAAPVPGVGGIVFLGEQACHGLTNRRGGPVTLSDEGAGDGEVVPGFRVGLVQLKRLVQVGLGWSGSPWYNDSLARSHTTSASGRGSSDASQSPRDASWASRKHHRSSS